MAQIEDSDTNVFLNMVKWIVVLAMVGGGIVANQIFASHALAVRASVGILLSVVALLIIATTSQGKRVRVFANEAQIELRKVVWPTRQETVQQTVVVLVLVVILGLILWAVDTGILAAISAIMQ